MAQVYLYFNSLLYLVVAVRSTLVPQQTAARLGYLTLSAGGRAEYLVVYGGLQLGLAILFCLLAQQPAYFQLGLLIAMGFYAPIVLYRIVAGLVNSSLNKAALGTITVEVIFFLAASWLYYKLP